ncbi:MAG: hypothetical protein WDN09_02860 [bacterium]
MEKNVIPNPRGLDILDVGVLHEEEKEFLSRWMQALRLPGVTLYVGDLKDAVGPFVIWGTVYYRSRLVIFVFKKYDEAEFGSKMPIAKPAGEYQEGTWKDIYRKIVACVKINLTLPVFPEEMADLMYPNLLQ